MAQVPDSAGVQQVEPDARPPADYQEINATPASFGGLIAQGEEKAGAGATDASNNLFNIADFQGKVNTDDQVNKWVEGNNKILYGDPSKPAVGPDGQPVMGPDGKPQPDRGFMGLEGRAAADKREETLQALEDQRMAGRKNLNPKDQILYDEQTQRMYGIAEREMGQHADTQWQVWAGGVNGSGASIALSSIARTPDDLEQFKHNTSDLINFRVQEAQIRYGNDPTILKQVEDEAKAEATTARLQAIAVKDPQRALDLTDQYKNTLSIVDKKTGQSFYDALSGQFRARADQQTGIAAGTAAIKSTYQQVPPTSNMLPVLSSVGEPYGISGSYLLRTHQLEGDGTSSTGAKGPFQFVDKTAAEYGVKNPYDFVSSATGAAQLAANNKAQLTTSFGRPPTDAELYLAHQQGATGAAKLLANPTVRAGDVVGDRAIAVNGGDPNRPASEFTGMWTAKFNGAPGALSHARKASAYQTIASDPNLSETARAHAFQYVNQTIAAQQIAQESDIKAQKIASDNAANGYVQRMLKGDFNGITQQVADDPNLTWETRRSLGDAAIAHGGDDTQQATQAYGAGFWPAYKAILADSSDPGRISEMHQLLERAGPGADQDQKLTLAGVEKLNGVMTQNRKSVDDQAANRAKLGLMTYAKGKLSFEQDTGPIKIRDPEGERLFNAQFIPKFEAGYEQWTKAGKNPWDFLTQKHVDEMLTGMRDKTKMQMDRMAAMGEAVPEDKNAPVPPSPDGVDAKAWGGVIADRPKTEAGDPVPQGVWATAVGMLLKNPTPETVKMFNASKFGRAGYDGQKILDQLRPAAAGAAPTADQGPALVGSLAGTAHAREVFEKLGVKY